MDNTIVRTHLKAESETSAFNSELLSLKEGLKVIATDGNLLLILSSS